MKTVKIGLVVLSALHLCYSVDIGDVVVQDENLLGAYDEDLDVLDLSNVNVDKLISETDDEQLDEIFRLATRVTVSDISFKSLKKLCQYSDLLIDIESQGDVLDCADVKRESRLVKRETDDSEDSFGSGASQIDDQEEEEPSSVVPAVDAGDASGDSGIEFQDPPPNPVIAEEHVDTAKEYENPEAQGNVDETVKETDSVDSISNPDESKNVEASQLVASPSETVDQPPVEEAPSEAPPTTSAPNSSNVDETAKETDSVDSISNPDESKNVEASQRLASPSETVDQPPVEEAPSEASEAAEAPPTTGAPNSNSEDETVATASEEGITTTTAEPENNAETAAEETLPKDTLTPIPSDQDVLPDEIKKAGNEENPSIVSRTGTDFIQLAHVPIAVRPEETTVTTVANEVITQQPKLGEVDSVDSVPKSDLNAPRQSNTGVGDATDTKEKDKMRSGTEQKATVQTDQDQQAAAAKSGISGLNVFIFFVIAAAVAGAAVFGYKMYRKRQVSYDTVNTGEDFGKELQEVKVKRADDDRNVENAKEAKPLIFNDLDITEVEDQQPHTPQPTPRTFKVTPSNMDQDTDDVGYSTTKKYDEQ